MKQAFVIGHPIRHSRSPLIHNHWLQTYGIEGSYEAIDVAPQDLSTFLDRIRADEFVGGNVTLPHKETVFALCDLRDPTTSAIGAFNTLEARHTAQGTKIWGTNTDLYGFLANLDQNAPGWSEGLDSAIVLGAGGAARAVAVALSQRISGVVRVLNRSLTRAQALVQDLRSNLVAHQLDEFTTLAPDCQLVVNTTTIGMHGTRFEGLELSRLPQTALVTDIVYVPLITPLLAEAQAAGLRTVDGLGMLLHQAVPGFEAWFGVRPEVTPVLRAAVEASL